MVHAVVGRGVEHPFQRAEFADGFGVDPGLVGKHGDDAKEDGLGWEEETPSHHRVHHGPDRKYLDKNYAGILIIWDRMFGSFQEEEETPRYGLTTDFDSQNPLRVWTSELPELGRDLKRAKSTSDVAGYLFKGPGWRPKKQTPAE